MLCTHPPPETRCTGGSDEMSEVLLALKLCASLVLQPDFPLPQNTFVTHTVKGPIVELALTPRDCNGQQGRRFSQALSYSSPSSLRRLGVFALTWLSLQGDQWTHWKPCWASLFLPDVQIPYGLGRKEFSVHTSVFVSFFLFSSWTLCCPVVPGVLIGDTLMRRHFTPSLREKCEPIQFLPWPQSGSQGLMPQLSPSRDSWLG